MKGIQINQLPELLSFIQENHRFALWCSEEEVTEKKKKFPKMDEYNLRHGKCIKYVDMCYDSRDGSVWMVKLRGIGGAYIFSTNHFSMINKKPEHFKFESLFDWIMAFLKCDWNNEVILKQCLETK